MRPQSLPEKLLLTAVAFAAILAMPNCGAAPAAAAETEAVSGPELELVATTVDCPEGVTLRGTPGEAAVIDFVDFEAQADLEDTRVRAFCAVTLKLSVPHGLQALVAPPEIHGTSTHTPRGTAALSVRWFAAGTPGDQWFKKVAPDSDVPAFVETPSTWASHWYACGESPELTLLVDMTARVRPGDDAPADLTEALGVSHVQLPAVLYKRCAADR